MSDERRRAELEQSTRAAVAALAGDVLRLSTVLRVVEAGGEDGRPLVVLDWVGDGTAEVEAASNTDVVFQAGNIVLVVMIGRSPVVVCKVGGTSPDNTTN